jgi:hypothetical protein
MRVGILQSNYLPWKGYFDIISKVDLFVFHDDLQYTKGDWRNRNRVRGPNGLVWLTIPCGTNEKRLICQVEMMDSAWQRKHWNLLNQYYKKAPYWSNYKDFFEEVYLGKTWNKLSELNQYLIKEIATQFLGITTMFEDSRKYSLTEKKAGRVIELLKKTNATSYLSGPAAKSYLSEEDLLPHGIQLEWMDYSNYPEYDQGFSPFTHEVSIIDVIFNTGLNMRKFVIS